MTQSNVRTQMILCKTFAFEGKNKKRFASIRVPINTVIKKISKFHDKKVALKLEEPIALTYGFFEL